MNANNLAKLEKDTKFKKEYFPKYFWFSQPGIYPPASILFIALCGLLYLLNSDMLISYYAIPFVVLLVIGAIFLKTTKRHIVNLILNDENMFKVCLAEVFQEKEGYIYLIFNTSAKRHEKYFIDNLRKDIQEQISLNNKDVEDSVSKSKRNTTLLYINNYNKEETIIKAFQKKDIIRLYPGIELNGSLAVIYFKEKNVMLVKPKHLVFK